jgi:hypothetical protein
MLAAMSQQIRIDVRHHDQTDRSACLTMTITARGGQAFAHDLDVGRAVVAGGSFDALPPSHLQVLRSEIMAGCLTAKRQAQGGWTVVLDRLGGGIGEQSTISDIPSIGWAVAATLAVLHGTGAEDLETSPRGGHGWKLDAIKVDSF